MKKIFTLFTALLFIVTASQNVAAVTKSMPGTNMPSVGPNPAHDVIKVNWEQSQCDNVTIVMFYTNGTVAKVLANRQYCDGIYSELFKVAGMKRGPYMLKVQIGLQKWSYKLILQ